MAYISLSRNDINVLEKIKDPEADPTAIVLVDPQLPRDPHITDVTEYTEIVKREREILLAIQKLELQLANLQPPTISEPVAWYRDCLSKLNDIIHDYPNYASARNNRAQALRRLYGDSLLVGTQSSKALISQPDEEARKHAAKIVLDDLDVSIRLLSPLNLSSPISPQAAKTLSMSYTQRAALYHATAKSFTTNIAIPNDRREADWCKLDFEEAAAGDFAMGGRYGNDIAKGLAVSVNPTAKLCGQMVREAMKKEYGPAFAS